MKKETVKSIFISVFAILIGLVAILGLLIDVVKVNITISEQVFRYSENGFGLFDFKSNVGCKKWLEIFGGVLSIVLCVFGGITIMFGLFSVFTKKLRIVVFILVILSICLLVGYLVLGFLFANQAVDYYSTMQTDGGDVYTLSFIPLIIGVILFVAFLIAFFIRIKPEPQTENVSEKSISGVRISIRSIVSGTLVFLIGLVAVLGLLAPMLQWNSAIVSISSGSVSSSLKGTLDTGFDLVGFKSGFFKDGNGEWVKYLAGGFAIFQLVAGVSTIIFGILSVFFVKFKAAAKITAGISMFSLLLILFMGLAYSAIAEYYAEEIFAGSVSSMFEKEYSLATGMQTPFIWGVLIIAIYSVCNRIVPDKYLYGKKYDDEAAHNAASVNTRVSFRTISSFALIVLAGIAMLIGLGGAFTEAGLSIGADMESISVKETGYTLFDFGGGFFERSWKPGLVYTSSAFAIAVFICALFTVFMGVRAIRGKSTGAIVLITLDFIVLLGYLITSAIYCGEVSEFIGDVPSGYILLIMCYTEAYVPLIFVVLAFAGFIAARMLVSDRFLFGRRAETDAVVEKTAAKVTLRSLISGVLMFAVAVTALAGLAAVLVKVKVDGAELAGNDSEIGFQVFDFRSEAFLPGSHTGFVNASVILFILQCVFACIAIPVTVLSVFYKNYVRPAKILTVICAVFMLVYMVFGFVYAGLLKDDVEEILTLLGAGSKKDLVSVSSLGFIPFIFGCIFTGAWIASIFAVPDKEIFAAKNKEKQAVYVANQSVIAPVNSNFAAEIAVSENIPEVKAVNHPTEVKSVDKQAEMSIVSVAQPQKLQISEAEKVQLLRDYAQLLKDGIITQEEFDAKKKELL